MGNTEMINVLHIIQGFTSNLGGLTSSTVELMDVLQNDRIESLKLLTPDSKNHEQKLMCDGAGWLFSFPYDLKTPIGYSLNAKRILNKVNYDIYHINGLWQYILHKACSAARKQNKPYLITPHGMLYPEALKRSAWKKWLLRKCWFNVDIENASCIHATCIREMENIRQFGYKGPIAVIGNPIKVPYYTKEIIENRNYDNEGRLRIGFLGRLHPIKCIDRLIEALALSKSKDDIELVLIGSGDTEFENKLKSLISSLGLESSVVFQGFLEGREKYEQLARITALFLPSEMENFGMIVLESLAVGTPVMASLGTPWQKLELEKCGWWCDNSPQKIAQVIDEIFELSSRELKDMGIRGRNLVLREFEAKVIAQKMSEVYSWLLNKDEKPDFVYEY